MAQKNTAVFALFRTPESASDTVDLLTAAGFASEDISVLMSDEESAHEIAHEKNTKAPEGTTTGAIAGATLGGALGLLAGIGALAIPGVGPFIAAGPIMGALSGIGAGGVLGGISTGQDITVSIAIKPTSSIRTPRRSIDKAGAPATVETFGRHDPCVGIRATPIAEAMLALVLIDHALRHRAQNADVVVPTPKIAASDE